MKVEVKVSRGTLEDFPKAWGISTDRQMNTHREDRQIQTAPSPIERKLKQGHS